MTDKMAPGLARAIEFMLCKYSQTCIKRSALGQRKGCLLRQVTSLGADPGFQVRGAGALKKSRRAEGDTKICWGISCVKS